MKPNHLAMAPTVDPEILMNAADFVPSARRFEETMNLFAGSCIFAGMTVAWLKQRCPGLLHTRTEFAAIR